MSKPGILITGASGFIGRNFINAIKDKYVIYAFTWRSKIHPEHVDHPNIHWFQVDIGIQEHVQSALDKIKTQGKIDFVLHLAGFYDFNYDNNPQYYQTNYLGTKYLLEELKSLKIKRFIFASSLAACEFSGNKHILTEKSPTDAQFAYAVTKHQAEELLKEYQDIFPVSIIRLAAVFSDWCEYGPLYIFLQTWLTANWKNKVLGGKGFSAITYIHIHDLVKMIQKILSQTQHLKNYDIFIASPDSPVTHKQLFVLSTWFYYGKSKKPVFMPKFLAYIGLHLLDFFGRFINKRPFERPWMIKYIDKQLSVNASYTRKTLNWNTTKRYSVERRLLFLIEMMKSYPYEWQARNLRAMKKVSFMPNYLIYEALQNSRDSIINQILAYLKKPSNEMKFPNYRVINDTTLRKDILTIYQFLSISVRTRDRMSMLSYAKEIATVRHNLNFSVEEVIRALSSFSSIIYENLIIDPKLKDYKQDIYDVVAFTFQLLIDEVEDAFDKLITFDE